MTLFELSTLDDHPLRIKTTNFDWGFIRYLASPTRFKLQSTGFCLEQRAQFGGITYRDNLYAQALRDYIRGAVTQEIRTTRLDRTTPTPVRWEVPPTYYTIPDNVFDET